MSLLGEMACRSCQDCNTRETAAADRVLKTSGRVGLHERHWQQLMTYEGLEGLSEFIEGDFGQVSVPWRQGALKKTRGRVHWKWEWASVAWHTPQPHRQSVCWWVGNTHFWLLHYIGSASQKNLESFISRHLIKTLPTSCCSQAWCVIHCPRPQLSPRGAILQMKNPQIKSFWGGRRNASCSVEGLWLKDAVPTKTFAGKLEFLLGNWDASCIARRGWAFSCVHSDAT